MPAVDPCTITTDTVHRDDTELPSGDGLIAPGPSPNDPHINRALEVGLTSALPNITVT